MLPLRRYELVVYDLFLYLYSRYEIPGNLLVIMKNDDLICMKGYERVVMKETHGMDLA